MKLLLAIDGSEYSHRALDFLQAFTLPPETELTLLTVVDKEAWPEGLDDARLTGEQRDSLQKMRDMLGADAEKLLEEGCSRLADRQVRCRTRKRFGQPAEEIVNAAAELDADLVIMGSHGHGDIERFLLGSVSDQVLHHAHCSVLVVRADQPPAGDNQPSPDIPLRILLAYDDSIHARRASEFCATLPLPGDTRVTAVSVLPLVTAYRQDIRLHQGWMSWRYPVTRGRTSVCIRAGCGRRNVRSLNRGCVG